MPITIVCPECKKQYRAPDAMAGRKVRCKGCHNVFAVSRGADSQGTSSGSVMDLNAHAQSEYGQTAYTGGGDDEGGIGLREPGLGIAVPCDPNAVFESAFQSFVPDRRENVPFKFPWSRQLDKATPWLLFVVALWVTLPPAIRVTASVPGWVPVVRVAVLVATFLLIVYPLTRMALTRAARVLRFELPPGSKWRTVTSFALPFGLVYALWSISTDVHFGFVAGSVMAVLLASATVYFLFRLEPREAAGTLSRTVGAFLVSLLLTVGVMLGLNWLAMEVAKGSGGKGGDRVALAVSPIAEGLKWEVPPPKADPTKGVPAGGVLPPDQEPEPLPPVVEAPTPPPPSPAPPVPAGDPSARPAQVVQKAPHDPGSSKLFPNPAPGGTNAGTTRPAGPNGVAVVRTTPPRAGANPQTTTPPPAPPTGTDVPPPAPAPPAGADPVAARIRQARSSLVVDFPDTSAIGTFERLVPSATPSPWLLVVRGSSVQTWDLKTWKPGPAGELTPAGDDPRVAPTVVPTPDGRSVVRAVSFPQLSLRVEPIDPANGPAAQSAVIKQDFGRASVEGMMDADRVLVRWEKSGEQGLEVWNMKTGGHGKRIALPRFQHAPSNGRMSPDGKSYALVAQATAPADRNGPPGSPPAGPRPHLYVFDLNRGTSLMQPITAVDARWATQPTGMAFSPDGRYLAVMFEQSGGGVVLTWRLPLSRVQPVTATLGAAQLPPPPPAGDQGPANRLDAIGGGAWLVAGNLVIAADDGAVRGDLGLAGAPDAGGAEALPPIVTQHVYGDTVLLTHGPPNELRATAVKLDGAKLKAAAAPPK